MEIIDYTKAVIYMIQHNENKNLMYIGSTTNFTNRQYHHKASCHNSTGNKYNLLVYSTIRANGGWSSFNMQIIKEYPCNSKIELLKEESRYMHELKSTLNNHRAFVTREQRRDKKNEWCNAHREHISIYNKKRYQMKKSEQRAETTTI